ncbi:recombinase family protein [Nitrosococcus wardiae]|uniref:Recombinase domain-containing protein n=1 Tax=Nitrosococcus wardiae TaxID=1814290 RepID=A0A4P7C215_9GAMM|nr:recombinase family protein [Nitrosococcus wardiae]QBQ55534.1 hypothetical protein E3U44_14210 [Nitrosococcus wardiae]
MSEALINPDNPLFELMRSGVLQPNDIFNLAYRQTMEILIEKGYSLSQITKRLNEWGYKTKRGEEWTRENVHKVLKELGLKTVRGSAA